MLFDYHVHTRYSADSRAPVIEQLRAAKKAGVTHICFTDHVDFDGVGLRPADIAARNAEIEALKGQFPDIDISFGMELGMKDKAAYEDAYSHVKDCHIDFVILLCFTFFLCNMFLCRDLTDAVCDVLIAEFLYDFLRTGNNKIRYSGKFCNLDTITFVCSTFYDLS